MATSVGGTNYSWHALEPFPIETPLAEEATGSAQGSKSAGIALSLLGRYQAERDMQQAQYGEDVRQQQAYQRDVLASQMMDNTMRAINEAGKSGTLPLFGPQYASLPGASSDAYNRVVQQLNANQNAANFKNIGQGTQGLVAGGVGVPAQDIAAMTGLPGLTQQLPTQVWAAQMRGQYGLAAARARANAPAAPSTHVAPGAPGYPPTVTYTYPGKMPQAAIDADMRNKGLGGLPGYTSGGGGGQGGGGGGTNLQTAPATNAPAGLPDGSTQLNTATKDGATAQTSAQMATQ